MKLKGRENFKRNQVISNGQRKAVSLSWLTRWGQQRKQAEVVECLKDGQIRLRLLRHLTQLSRLGTVTTTHRSAHGESQERKKEKKGKLNGLTGRTRRQRVSKAAAAAPVTPATVSEQGSGRRKLKLLQQLLLSGRS